MAVLGRPREFDRAAALKAAMGVFWRNGFTSTSMNDLCEAMGIRSPSLYAAFGSKEALYVEALEHYIAARGQPVWDQLSQGATAKESVARMLYAATQSLPAKATPTGCMATLAALSDAWPKPLADKAKTFRRQMLGLLRSRLRAAVSHGELDPSTDIERLSRFYLGVFQGMAVQARDGATVSDLQGVAETAMQAWPPHPAN